MLKPAKSPGLSFFLHKSKVQRVYRGFLRICQSDEERREVRSGFDNQIMKISQAETRLQTLQLARGGTLQDMKQQPNAERVEWPWQKRGK